MTSPFDFAKSINSSKEDLFSTDQLFNQEYNPYMVNKILSNNPNTVLFADAMNQYPALDKKLQYEFYLKGIPIQRNYSKWVKKENSEIDDDYIQAIAYAFTVSLKRANELYALIPKENIKEYIDSKGGTSK